MIIYFHFLVYILPRKYSHIKQGVYLLPQKVAINILSFVQYHVNVQYMVHKTRRMWILFQFISFRLHRIYGR